MNTMETILEFDRIKEKLADCALSQNAKDKLYALSPYYKEKECRRHMEETTAARKVLDALGAPPLSPMERMGPMLVECEKGVMLLPEELERIAAFCVTCRRLSGYLKRAEEIEPAVGGLWQSISDLSSLEQEIENAVRSGQVDSAASPALRSIERKMENLEAGIKGKLESLLRGHRSWFSDGYIAARDGHFVLPVKKEYRTQVKGSVIGTSSTGGTCFIEPSSVAKMQAELAALSVERENEIRTVLYTLSALVDDCISQLRWNMEAMETADVLFAKAKLSTAMDGVPAKLTVERKIHLKNARHPLIDVKTCVPLNYSMGDAVRGVVVTGPNTGGKTVALKTVGLLSLMAQCGLHIPADDGCVIAMHANILCDIGDGQSITQNLSTFSAHMTGVIRILEQAGPQSLVLLDELGSGTDPAEGMGIAVAVLEELRRKGCLFLVTTHYPQVKDYACGASGLVNARMAFDRETLRPLYRLEVGQAGESCALYIAKRLGFPGALLDHACREAYGEAAGGMLPSLLQGAAASLAVQKLPRLEAEADQKEPAVSISRFEMGDSVRLTETGELGIVYRPANEQGELAVQVKGEKRMVSHKRLKLEVPASELYPPDYDFSILFDSVANRKARHQMEKKHCADLTVSCEEEMI